MKFYKRLFSVFAVCAILSATFSITANAADTEKFINGQQQSLYLHKSNDSEVFLSPTLYSWEDSYYYDYSFFDKVSDFSKTNYPYFRITYTLRNEDYSTLFNKDDKTTVYYDTGYVYVRPTLSSSNVYPTGDFVKQATYTLKYTDGTFSNTYPIPFDNVTYNPSNNHIEIKAEILKAPKDVSYVQFKVYYHWSTFGLSTVPKYYCFGMDDSNFSTRYVIEDETKGLLSSIIDWIKSIFSKIGDIFDTVSYGFASIGTWFAELPAKLWAVISDGLKSLFVPDENYMVEYSDKWDELLSSRFGAVYQVGSIISDFASRITVSDKTNTINIPSVSLSSVGVPFSFGGYSVQIVPNGFNVIVETLKSIISIVCTFMFVNGLRKRYDEVMGVEQ